MITRALTLIIGLGTGAGMSQFPEFSQQYAQRLGGAVDALGEVVADFDASAAAEGFSRAQALDQMQGTDFIARRRSDMERTFARHADLSESLAALDGHGPFMRAYHANRFGDADIARATWKAYEPAVPLNMAGGIFAGVGLIAGLIGGALGLSLLGWPVRALMRRRRADPGSA